MASAIWKFPWGPLVAESGLAWGVSWGVWRVIYFGLQEALRGRRGDLQGPMDREQFDIENIGDLCTPCDMYVAGSAVLRTARSPASTSLGKQVWLPRTSGELPLASAGRIALDLPPPASAGLRPASAEGEKTTVEIFENEALLETLDMVSCAKQGPLGIEPAKRVAPDSRIHMERDTGQSAFGPSRHRAWVVSQRSLLDACWDLLGSLWGASWMQF